MEYRCCILVPHYNHSEQFARFLPELVGLTLPITVVDDGSDPDHFDRLRLLLEVCPGIHLIRRDTNEGKGAAVVEGARWARGEGFTHILQVDADGQHHPESVAAIVSASRAEPDALVSGLPQFGADVPASRLHGRKISLWWSRIETLSFEIKDAMCGFRVYPLASFLAVADRVRIGERMQFDNDIMVRLFWRGVRIRFVPVSVRYPVDGLSHFEMGRDNLRISLMHTKLFIGMLWRSPWLVVRNIARVMLPDQHARSLS